ncbi:ABC transporter ATP-binding protein [Candidatus Dependentiae bacterium]|nr:ABC transporter ATP-binding protein [Candidatus Dependentiae bacterium]
MEKNEQCKIILESVSKKYGDTSALENISFSVNSSEIFGFLGPDGSGKTSLFKIIATLIKQSEGKVSVNGLDGIIDYKKIRNIIGYMPERFSLYQDLSVEENLGFFADIFGTSVKQNYEIIRDIYSQIEPFKKRKAGKLSGGMKQKLALSCALIHKPEILILDEPTTGVDPVSRKEFWEILKKLKKNGITILVSTPYMDEAEMCDRTAFILKGKLLVIDKPSNIREKFNRTLYSVKSSNFHKLITDLKEYSGTYNVYPFGEYLHFIPENNTGLNDIEKYLNSRNHASIEIIKSPPEIEDCFMELSK